MQSPVPENPAAAESPSPVPDPRPGSHRKFIELLHELGGVLWEMEAATWRFTFVSERAERLFGYPIQRWYDEPTFWQDVLLHPADRDWCVSFCSAASRQCRNHAFLYRARTADGGDLWIKDVVRVIAGEGGGPAVMRGIMIDATEEVRGTHPLTSLELNYDAAELADLREILAA